MASVREIPRPAAAAAVDGNGEARPEELRELVASLMLRNEQLETALQSRIVIEQAKGILAERYSITVDDAFALLRRSARNHRLRLHALAAAVVASKHTPAEIPPPMRPAA